MTTPADRGFSEATDMYYEITEAINRKIEAIKTTPDWATRILAVLPGATRRIYNIINEASLETCQEIQEVVDDIYARHDDADYAGPHQ